MNIKLLPIEQRKAPKPAAPAEETSCFAELLTLAGVTIGIIIFCQIMFLL